MKELSALHFPVPIKAGSVSTYSATPGSLGSSEMRCPLSKHGNMGKGGEEDGLLQMLSFLLDLKIRFVFSFHMLRGG